MLLTQRQFLGIRDVSSLLSNDGELFLVEDRRDVVVSTVLHFLLDQPL